MSIPKVGHPLVAGDQIDAVWRRWLQSLDAAGITQAQADAAIASALAAIPAPTPAVIREGDGISVIGTLASGVVTISARDSSTPMPAVMARISLRC